MSRLFVFFSTIVSASAVIAAPIGITGSSLSKGDCADFNGSWQGQCSIPVHAEASVTIQQLSCDQIGIMGLPWLKPGGPLVTMANAVVNQAGSTGTLSLASEWQDGNKALVVGAAWVIQNPGVPVTAYTEKDRYSLENGALRIVSTRQDGSQVLADCRFLKPAVR